MPRRAADMGEPEIPPVVDDVVVVDDAEVDDALAQLAEVDRQNRVGRTTIQAGLSAAIVTVTEFVLAYFDADLDPRADGVQDTFPPVFTGALFVIVAWIAARAMNRKPS